MKEHAKQYKKLNSYLVSSGKLVLENEDLTLSSEKKVENEAQSDSALVIKQWISELNMICNLTKSATSNAKWGAPYYNNL
ncbi:8631_t:CDS:2 [Ambispora gerdemannii]|uniref:8631_t:CDS:1 n=1 Tax=Ambispora gerdemannii TaxID=144530 RepID=A0A9N9FE41_9GLOM|nr:8631_t:CDS:2 [Ambispora gerdemannii]